LSRKNHKKHAEKRERGWFVPMPHAVLRSAEFAALSPPAKALLLDFLAQYTGSNNGDMCAAWSIMQPRGWRSRDSLGRALRELLEGSWAIKTRQGGRRTASLFAVTMFEIDFCDGKLVIAAPSRKFMGSWRRSPLVSPAPPDGTSRKVHDRRVKESAETPLQQHDRRVNGASLDTMGVSMGEVMTRPACQENAGRTLSIEANTMIEKPNSNHAPEPIDWSDARVIADEAEAFDMLDQVLASGGVLTLSDGRVVHLATCA